MEEARDLLIANYFQKVEKAKHRAPPWVASKVKQQLLGMTPELILGIIMDASLSILFKQNNDEYVIKSALKEY
jgi:hypothetical protein